MPRISPSADEEQRLDRLAADTKSLFVIDSKYGTCSKCLTKVEVAYWGEHVCLLKDTITKQEEIEAEADREALPYSFAEATIDPEDEGAVVHNMHNKFIAKLYECVASHYENGDRTGAEAILNAIQYAQQN